MHLVDLRSMRRGGVLEMLLAPRQSLGWRFCFTVLLRARLRKSGEVRRDICCSSCTSLPVPYTCSIYEILIFTTKSIFFQQVSVAIPPEAGMPTLSVSVASPPDNTPMLSVSSPKMCPDPVQATSHDTSPLAAYRRRQSSK